MKKSIRNRLIVVAAAASSFWLLSGFDSEISVQEIISNSQAAVAASPGLSCQLQGNADVSLDMSLSGESQSLPVTGNVDFTVQYTKEPFCFAVTGTAVGDASVMGMAGDLNIDLYIVSQEDGSGIMYAYMPQIGDDQWHAASVTAEDMTKMSDMVTSSLSGDMSAVSGQTGIDVAALQESMYSDMAVSPEPETVDGIECYEVTSSITGDKLMEVISQVAAAVPEANIDESAMLVLQMVLSGVKVDTTTHYATDTFEPVAALVDLSASDFSSIAQMFGSMMMSSDSTEETQTPEIGVTVNALNIMAFYNPLDSGIEVPEEALAAEVETDASLSDAMNMADSATDTAVSAE